MEGPIAMECIVSNGPDTKQLKRILHEDDAESLLVQLELAKPLSLPQILQLSIEQPGEHASTADFIKCGRSDFASFLIAHSSLLEVAVCTLALSCVTHLIGELSADSGADAAAAALHQAVGESVVPLHCLIVKLLTLRGDAAFEDKAVRFVRKLSAEQPRFFRVCAEKEAFGLNALELAVSLQLFPLAECILESGKYCGEVSLIAGVKVQRVDLSEYDFDTGDRYDKSPLNMLAEMAVRDLTEPIKKFMDHDIISRWSERAASSMIRPLLFRSVFFTIYKLIILTFFPSCVYAAVTVERLSISGNYSACPLYPLNLQWLGTCRNPSVRGVMALLAAFLMAECVLILALNAIYVRARHSESSYLKSLAMHVWFSSQVPMRFVILCLCLVLTIYTNRAYAKSLVKPNGEVDLRFLDYSTILAYILTILSFVFDWIVIVDRMALLWNVMGIFLFFVVILFFVVALFGWLVAVMVPCESSFDPAISSDMLSYGLLNFYLLINNGGLSRDSVKSLGITYLVIHALIVLFCFNFLIALLSERLSAATRSLPQICLSYQLYVTFIVRLPVAFVLRKIGRLQSSRTAIFDAILPGSTEGTIYRVVGD